MRVCLLMVLILAGNAVATDLEPETIARLERDKVAYDSANCRQMFDPYIAAEVPVFITSDTVLHAWHVLLERTLQRMEEHRARLFPKACREILTRLPDGVRDLPSPADAQQRALKRAQRVMGVALLLAGGGARDLPAELREQVESEVKRVLRGQGMGKPEWLGPPEPDFIAIDYGDFRPSGQHAEGESLSGTYRATRWLQTIPFFVDRDEDLMALYLVERARMGLQQVHAAGFAHDVNLAPLTQVHQALGPAGPVAAAALRSWARNSLAGARRADLVAEQHSRPNLRVLPMLRLPEDALWGERRAFPLPPIMGRELCAALGSEWARGHLEDDPSRRNPLEVSDTIASAYVQCVAKLIDPPDPLAPALFSGEAWKRKSCRTVLASWAQWRHSVALFASSRMSVFGHRDGMAGFVEPDPGFFAELAALAERTRAWAEAAGCLSDAIDRAALAAFCATVAAGIEDGSFTRATLPWLAAKLLEPEQLGRLDEAQFRSKAAAVLRRHSAHFENLARPLSLPLRETLQRVDRKLEWRWKRLRECCLQLGALAEKQIRGKEWTKEEEQWIRAFGPLLATLVFYDSTSYVNPQDDIPKVAVVSRDPHRGQRLHVAVGRPRPIYILYPWKGEEVRCRGAVLDHYEFESPTALTDAEFKGRLDGPDAPRRPSWLEGE